MTWNERETVELFKSAMMRALAKELKDQADGLNIM